jgi:L-lactate dehydrogenase
MSDRFDASTLTDFSTRLLTRAGLDDEKSRVVAEVLVEGDLLGHTTHGLALLGPYLGELEKNTMSKTGGPKTVADFPAAVTWDGNRLPGPWLTVRAIELAIARAKTLGVCTIAIRRSHHIACLAAYLRRATDQNMLIMLSCSDPAMASVAPHGGTRAVYTPDPLAAAWPTEKGPVMLDVSMSITTNGMTNRARRENRTLAGPWLIDNQGNATDDPAVLSENPPGALLPMGGIDHGHKGYSLGLLVEAMTSGLCGLGRADPSEGWGANVFVQILNPALFGGAEAFKRQTQWLADACRSVPPRPGVARVRLPGEAGLQRREVQLKNGIELYPGILDLLKPWAEKFQVALPNF